NTKPSGSFSATKVSRQRSGHMPASTAAGQRVGISISLRKPSPLKYQRGGQTGAIVRRSIRKAGTIDNGSRIQDLSAIRQLASRGSSALADGVQSRRPF